MSPRNDAALSLLADIRTELRKQREAMDRLATSNFGLSKDLRRWFKSRTTQPGLPLTPSNGNGHHKAPESTRSGDLEQEVPTWCVDCDRFVEGDYRAHMTQEHGIGG